MRRAWAFGVQAGLGFPASSDLRVTAGSPGLSLGLHATVELGGGHRLRPRLDYSLLPARTHSGSGSGYSQVIETQVSSLVLGTDWLWSPAGRWSLGLSASGVRWSVASTNTFASGLGGTVANAGISHTVRFGGGPVLTWRATEALELEARYLSSRYGRENASASTGSVGLVWRF